MGVAMNGVDIAVFVATTVGVMCLGMWLGRKEEGSEDFFLAGRAVPWWGVAGSIFGTNISANHLVGMLGVGFTVGFAQSHYEIGAIAGLMLLCYVFLPLYLRMKVYTLSEYLGARFGEESRVVYSAISVLLMDFIRMVMGLYIGGRSLAFLLKGTDVAINYETAVILLAAVTGAYTIFGGLKAVIWTDLIQSVLLMAASVTVALLVFSRPEVGGFFSLLSSDAALPAAEQRFHLYLPTNHPKLPWSGVMTGLFILHFNFWACNQYIVQRTLAARSEHDARLGIVAAGFLKLLVPFFTIAAGIAAAKLFTALDMKDVKSDDAFPTLVGLLVPVGYGLTGLIAAGLVGAILSSIDSMMNSGATMITFDFYKRFFRKEADEKELILFGRIVIAVFIVVGALLSVTILSPDRESDFFLTLSSATGHFVPGIVVAFLVGVFWRRATRVGSFLTLALSPFFSFLIVWIYDTWLGPNESVSPLFGEKLNFLHRTALTGLFGLVLMVVVSLLTGRWADREKARFTYWEYRKEEAGAQTRPFWRSEKPWAILLCACAIAMLIYFA